MDEQTIREWRRRAKGFTTREVTSEYAPDENGRLVETKRKVTRRRVPGDLAALRWLEENEKRDLDSLSDEELEREKLRFLRMLATICKEDTK